MCLYNLPGLVEKKVAPHDIHFYKTGHIDVNGDFIGSTMYHCYEKNVPQPFMDVKPVKAKNGFDRCTNSDEHDLLNKINPHWYEISGDIGLEVIREGYHGYLSFPDIDKTPDTHVGIFVMPAGTTYYINETLGIIVASTCTYIK